LIYELTSYVQEDEPISIQLVQFALAKLNHRTGDPIPVVADNRPAEGSIDRRGAISTSNASNMRSAGIRAFLCDMAREGDITLPVDLCILRRGETFKQWTARAKRSTIEAARQETGGTVQRVAERLGLYSSEFDGPP
jgi:hypothetical protein